MSKTVYCSGCCDKHNCAASKSIVSQAGYHHTTAILPRTQLLDVIFARNVATERRKNKFLFVEAAAEVLEVARHCHVLVKFFLGSVQVIGNDNISEQNDNTQLIKCDAKYHN